MSHGGNSRDAQGGATRRGEGFSRGQEGACSRPRAGSEALANEPLRARSTSRERQTKPDEQRPQG